MFLFAFCSSSPPVTNLYGNAPKNNNLNKNKKQKMKGVEPPQALLPAPAQSKLPEVNTPGTTRNNGARASAFTSPAKAVGKTLANSNVFTTPSASSRDNSDRDKTPSPKTPTTIVRDGDQVRKKRRSVRKWTAEEDEQMRVLVKRFGTRKWSTIGGFLEGRNGKQCRERWHNQLDPAIKKCAWGEDEEVCCFFIFLFSFIIFFFFL